MRSLPHSKRRGEFIMKPDAGNAPRTPLYKKLACTVDQTLGVSYASEWFHRRELMRHFPALAAFLSELLSCLKSTKFRNASDCIFCQMTCLSIRHLNLSPDFAHALCSCSNADNAKTNVLKRQAKKVPCEWFTFFAEWCSDCQIDVYFRNVSKIVFGI